MTIGKDAWPKSSGIQTNKMTNACQNEDAASLRSANVENFATVCDVTIFLSKAANFLLRAICFIFVTNQRLTVVGRSQRGMGGSRGQPAPSPNR